MGKLEELDHEARHGDQNAKAKLGRLLVDQAAKWIVRLNRGLVNCSITEAKDVYMDAVKIYLKDIDKKPDRETSNVNGLLWEIAHGRHIKQYKKQTKKVKEHFARSEEYENRQGGQSKGEKRVARFTHWDPSRDIGAERPAEQSEALALEAGFYACLYQLGTTCKDILVKRFVEKKTARAIAREVSLPSLVKKETDIFTTRNKWKDIWPEKEDVFKLYEFVVCHEINELEEQVKEKKNMLLKHLSKIDFEEQLAAFDHANYKNFKSGKDSRLQSQKIKTREILICAYTDLAHHFSPKPEPVPYGRWLTLLKHQLSDIKQTCMGKMYKCLKHTFSENVTNYLPTLAGVVRDNLSEPCKGVLTLYYSSEKPPKDMKRSTYIIEQLHQRDRKNGSNYYKDIKTEVDLKHKKYKCMSGLNEMIIEEIANQIKK